MLAVTWQQETHIILIHYQVSRTNTVDIRKILTCYSLEVLT